MNKFTIHIKDIQQIKELNFSINLNTSGLHVIVGKNGVGKTILFKGIQNLVTSNTFVKTSNSYIYKQSSSIKYSIIEDTSTLDYLFVYNEQVKTVDFKGEVDSHILDNIYVELPIPFGKRFSQFQRLGELDGEIRLNIISKKYEEPTALISLLNYIYDTDRFNDLKAISIKKEKYYVRVLEDDYYIREDYLSSAEYFIISIYKIIQKKCKLIAIDEIDISLDAMAQVRFIEKLRELSREYNIKILFSTHSLALIKTLSKEELHYMELKEGICSFENKSYNYIKSLLYGFQDYDKYILTEDKILKDYMEYLLRNRNIFSKYIILPIGTHDSTVRLMEINVDKKVFEHQNNVCCVLDGDAIGQYPDREDIYFLPFLSVEKELHTYFNNGDGFIDFDDMELRSNNLTPETSPKILYKRIVEKDIKTQYEIFEFITNKNSDKVNPFRETLCTFLGERTND